MGLLRVQCVVGVREGVVWTEWLDAFDGVGVDVCRCRAERRVCVDDAGSHTIGKTRSFPHVRPARCVPGNAGYSSGVGKLAGTLRLEEV
jgi:hypothetical protein